MKYKSLSYKLNYLLSSKDKQALFILLIMSLLLSTIETVGITAVMPFISLASDPKLLDTNHYYKMLYELFSCDSQKEFVIYFGYVLILFYILRGFFTVFYNYIVNAFSLKKYFDLTNQIYDNYINLSYKKFVGRNSASMSKVIVSEAAQVAVLIQNVLIFFSELLIITLIYIVMLVVNIKMTIVLTLILAIKIFFLTQTISKFIKKKGHERAEVQEKLYRIISETLANYKVIKFISNQEQLLKKFSKITADFSNIHTINNTVQSVPKSFLEAVGLSLLIGTVIYVLNFSSNIANLIPIITMYALALYRILPAISKIVNSYNYIQFNLASLDIVYEDFSLQNENELNENILFQHSISLNNVSFSYNGIHDIIHQIDLKIPKNSKVAFVGKSGSGKSTLVDIICGIYKPDAGNIFIDDVKLDNNNIKSWRKMIGYIPQAIYLFDGTITDNITFGRPYDEEKLTKVLQQANIYDLIMSKEGFETIVGEGGIKLSGGQKQRIGIARALYGDPEILVLDEATSALDTATEKAIMDEIYKVSENKTLIIIAHRLSTIEQCNLKINIDKVKE